MFYKDDILFFLSFIDRYNVRFWAHKTNSVTLTEVTVSRQEHERSCTFCIYELGVSHLSPFLGLLYPVRFRNCSSGVVLLFVCLFLSYPFEEITS